MKKILLLLTGLMIASFLAACFSVVPSDSEPSMPSETQIMTTIPEFDIPPMPTNPKTEFCAPFDSLGNEDICILTGSNSSIYYVSEYGDLTYNFLIYSKRQLNAEQINVSIPIQHSYRVSVKEVSLEGDLLYENIEHPELCDYNQYPYYLYLAQQGKDFSKLAKLKWKANQIYIINEEYEKKFNNNEIEWGEYQRVQALYLAAISEYNAYRDSELENYRALTREDLPQFYVYSVSVRFEPTQKTSGEIFTYIDVTIEDIIYKKDVGFITLKESPELPAQLDWDRNGFNIDDGVMGYGNAPMPYNEGLHCINIYFHFEADAFKSLKRVVLDNPAHRIDRVWVMNNTADGDYYLMEWDMSQPLDIYPGDDVVIYVSYQDDYKQSLGYQTKLYGFLEYESDGESWCKLSECSITGSLNAYEVYGYIFEGLDLQSYYWGYYYPLYEPWRLDGVD